MRKKQHKSNTFNTLNTQEQHIQQIQYIQQKQQIHIFNIFIFNTFNTLNTQSNIFNTFNTLNTHNTQERHIQSTLELNIDHSCTDMKDRIVLKHENQIFSNIKKTRLHNLIHSVNQEKDEASSFYIVILW